MTARPAYAMTGRAASGMRRSSGVATASSAPMPSSQARESVEKYATAAFPAVSAMAQANEPAVMTTRIAVRIPR